MLAIFFSAIGMAASFVSLRCAIMCGMYRLVHGARHRDTRREFWFAVALAIVASIAFMNAGGAYQHG